MAEEAQGPEVLSGRQGVWLEALQWGQTVTEHSSEWNMGQVVLGLLLAGVLAISGWTLSSIHTLASEVAVVQVKLQGVEDRAAAASVDTQVLSTMGWKLGEMEGQINALQQGLRSNWPRDRAQDQNDQIFKRFLEKKFPDEEIKLRVIEEH